MVKKIRNWLDDWAARRFLSRLDETDPLTVRRLRFALEEGLTLDEVIALEEEGINQLARTIGERAEDNDSPTAD